VTLSRNPPKSLKTTQIALNSRYRIAEKKGESFWADSPARNFQEKGNDRALWYRSKEVLKRRLLQKIEKHDLTKAESKPYTGRDLQNLKTDDLKSSPIKKAGAWAPVTTTVRAERSLKTT